MRQNLFLILGFWMLVGCESASPGAEVDIPSITMSCTTALCKAAPSSDDTVSYTAYANITLSGCDADQINLDPIAASSATVTCVTTVGCSGVINEWRNNSGTSITTMGLQNGSVCARIDLDGVASPSPSDEYDELNFTTTTFPTLVNFTTWGAANYFTKLPESN